MKYVSVSIKIDEHSKGFDQEGTRDFDFINMTGDFTVNPAAMFHHAQIVIKCEILITPAL